MAITETSGASKYTRRSMSIVTFTWTCDASGDHNSGASTASYCGLVRRVVTIPDATDAPTDDYDIELRDSNACDVLAAGGANRDTANVEQVTPSAPVPINSTLTLVVSNAGDTKAGTVIVYIE